MNLCLLQPLASFAIVKTVFDELVHIVAAFKNPRPDNSLCLCDELGSFSLCRVYWLAVVECEQILTSLIQLGTGTLALAALSRCLGWLCSAVRVPLFSGQSAAWTRPRLRCLRFGFP